MLFKVDSGYFGGHFRNPFFVKDAGLLENFLKLVFGRCVPDVLENLSRIEFDFVGTHLKLLLRRCLLKQFLQVL
jgi:hypothetical protein